MDARLGAVLVAAALSFSANAATRVTIETDLGAIEVEIDDARAPATAANFLRYVDAGRYDGGRWTVKLDNQPDSPVKIEVIQGGTVPGSPGWAAIPLERTSVTGIRHVDGAISMARSGPETATSDFFITIGAQRELDFGGKRNPDGQGFAAFGRVVSGMGVVRQVQRSPADGQRLSPVVLIRKISRK